MLEHKRTEIILAVKKYTSALPEGALNKIPANLREDFIESLDILLMERGDFDFAPKDKNVFMAPGWWISPGLQEKTSEKHLYYGIPGTVRYSYIINLVLTPENQWHVKDIGFQVDHPEKTFR